ncbi:MAG: AsmA family protein [Bacteroidales bacterium]|nr:AsmA family protein [Bacteroidales bacterium]
MKKPLKITLISVGSLLGLLLVAICVVLWLVLTPARLTPIVNRTVSSFITCPTRFEKVELTFFSSFPKVALRVEDVSLVHPMPGAPSDTLAFIHEVRAAVNLHKLLKDNVLEVKSLQLDQGVANLYTDAQGRQNFDVFVTDTTDTTSSGFPFDKISAEKLKISGMDVRYVDASSHLSAVVKDFHTKAKVSFSETAFDGRVKLGAEELAFRMEDSSLIAFRTRDFQIKVQGEAETGENNGLVRAELQCDLPEMAFRMDSLNLTTDSRLWLKLPLVYDMAARRVSLDKTELALDALKLKLDGDVQDISACGDFSAFDCDLRYALETLPLSELLPWVEKFSPGLLEGMDITGNLGLDGKVNGRYADSLLPLLTAHVRLEKGGFQAKELLPEALDNIVVDATAEINLNKPSASWAEVHRVSAETGKSRVQLQGSVKDLMDKLRCDMQLTGKIHLPDVQAFLPEDMPLQLRGSLTPNLKVGFALEDLQALDLRKIRCKGRLNFQSLHAVYDSLLVDSKELALDIQLPSPHKNPYFKEVMQAKVHTPALRADVSESVRAVLGQTELTVGLSDVTDTTRLPSVYCDFDFSEVQATADTLMAGIRNPKGSVCMRPSAKDAFSPSFVVNYRHASLSACMGAWMKAVTQTISVSGSASYDSTQTNVLAQWNPDLKVRLHAAGIQAGWLKEDVDVPDVAFTLTPSQMDLKSGRFALGSSEFNLSGTVKHLSDFLNDEGMLKANLKFESEYVDVNHLMEFFSGMDLGSDSAAAEPEEPTEDSPFMVPLGMDVTLNTHVTKLLVGQTIVDNLDGKLTVKDGVLVLEEMGFACDVARMQLTAMYKSPRKNHLFAYVDFHLLDISIADLIEMIPDIDTIVPMLKSFAGNAEFHFAAQTNLKSNYDIKYSTLRGAASISGKDLVVLDNETFTTIAKYLQFKKKTENKVDSLSVEMTVFQRNVDLYPFLISMDKYQAVVAGHYVMGKNYDCHLSLVDSPLPVRLGLNVYGQPEKIQYKLEKPQYATLFKPEKRKVVEAETMKLKQMITNSLRENVK